MEEIISGRELRHLFCRLQLSPLSALASVPSRFPFPFPRAEPAAHASQRHTRPHLNGRQRSHQTPDSLNQMSGSAFLDAWQLLLPLKLDEQSRRRETSAGWRPRSPCFCCPHWAMAVLEGDNVDHFSASMFRAPAKTVGGAGVPITHSVALPAISMRRCVSGVLRQLQARLSRPISTFLLWVV